jgi:hypothetical protein
VAGSSAKKGLLSRRSVLAASAVAIGVGGVAVALRGKLRNRLAAFTQLPSFAAIPPLVPHHPERDRAKLWIGRDGSPAANIDSVISKLGGIEKIVGTDDVVIIKVAAQWWSQGMSNVAAVKRVIEHILERPGFKGEVIVFENTHFRMPDGSGLSRAWVHPSERNVDVPGWNKLGDLIPHFKEKKAPVSFVGLVDGGPSSLSEDSWHDPQHVVGVYGGDGRGPIAPGDARDGYHWDFDRTFRLAKSWVDEAKTPLTWPRFTSPHSGLVVDLKDGVFRREGAVSHGTGKLVSAERKLTWINMTVSNEHGATGLTAACKSTMGVVDMSAGALGTHPLVKGYASVHYFGRGSPMAQWRMGGPLAYFAREVRSPDLILTVAEWVAYAPADWDGEKADIRHDATTCVNTKVIVGGTDPVAVDTWLARNVMMHTPAAYKKYRFDLDNEDSTLTKFLRYYRQVYEKGTLDASLIEAV